MILLLTCEHASNHVPADLRGICAIPSSVLHTHRGWDPGARVVAQRLSRHWKSRLLLGTHTRLVVDLNRTPDHPHVFSKWSRELTVDQKRSLLERLHEPYWCSAENFVRRHLRKSNPVLHLSIHSFTPVLRGSRRSTHVGLLLDPQRRRELDLARDWQMRLRRQSHLRVHRNLPYRGTGNGMVEHLRRLFPAAGYVGLEIELNQALLRTTVGARRIADLLFTSFPDRDLLLS